MIAISLIELDEAETTLNIKRKMEETKKLNDSEFMDVKS